MKLLNSKNGVVDVVAVVVVDVVAVVVVVVAAVVAAVVPWKRWRDLLICRLR